MEHYIGEVNKNSLFPSSREPLYNYDKSSNKCDDNHMPTLNLPKFDKNQPIIVGVDEAVSISPLL